MIDNTGPTKHAFSHTESSPCPSCDGDEERIFVVFHLENEDNLWQCTSCQGQFDSDGVPYQERREKFLK